MNRRYEWLQCRYPLRPLRVCHGVERQTTYFIVFPLVRPRNFQSTYVKRVSEDKRTSIIHTCIWARNTFKERSRYDMSDIQRRPFPQSRPDIPRLYRISCSRPILPISISSFHTAKQTCLKKERRVFGLLRRMNHNAIVQNNRSHIIRVRSCPYECTTFENRRRSHGAYLGAHFIHSFGNVAHPEDGFAKSIVALVFCW